LPHGETGLASVRIAAPALILDSASESAAARAALAAPPGAVRSMLGPDALPDATSAVNAMSATRMADPSNTVAQGTMMAAVLETAINSDLPGYVRAVVSEDVRGFDATLLLIPRGSHLIGQYKSGLADGQQRAYILWSRLLRPDGVSVDLASSPATDFAGNTGLTGDVDSHFFERFGSALLLSVVDMLSAVGGASVVISGSQSASSIALQHDGQIPPTVTVPQGTPIRIFTVRDLDFSTVAGEMAQK
jgi:type IV secretion system protein VirB10